MPLTDLWLVRHGAEQEMTPSLHVGKMMLTFQSSPLTLVYGARTHPVIQQLRLAW